jgi:hopanoid biosynthesis associated protein HpnK
VVKKIIINADDFGWSEGINQAIEQAHTEGVLTSATIMPNMPAAEQAVEIAKKLPNLGVGVHLNLMEAGPLSQDECIKALLDEEGAFGFTPGRLAVKSTLNKEVRLAIKTELAAQIKWVIDKGIKPTHLDSHKHIHSFPVIFSIVCGLARSFDISAIRFSFEPKFICYRPWPFTSTTGRQRASIVRKMARINRLQHRGLCKTGALLGVAHTGKVDQSYWRAITRYGDRLPPVIEVMTHPGYTEGLDEADTRLIKQRKVELDALCSGRTRQYLKDVGIVLVHYGQLENQTD